jgi:hypothetical protein
MKTKKTIFIIPALLALVLFTFNSCKRDTVEEPSPLGPSSIAVVLSLEACTNVIFAGLNERGSTNLTATLKKYDGSPLADRTIFFEVVDQDGVRVNLGYFQGGTMLLSKNTDSNGTVSTVYYGPLIEEITANGSLFIRATVAWEGSQFISDSTQLYIIRDSSDQLTLTLKAIPDILYSGYAASRSVIQARVFMGGSPVSGHKVYFTREPEDIGKFEGATDENAVALTNEEGIATVTYAAPHRWEIDADTEVIITALVTADVSAQVTIKIIRMN